MNRKQVIEHFRALAEIAGKNLKTEATKHGPRLICEGKSVVLPERSQRIRHIEHMESRLGLHSLSF